MPHGSLSLRPSLCPRALGAALLLLVLSFAVSACGRTIYDCNSGIFAPASALTISDGVVYARGAAGVSTLHASNGSYVWRSTNDASDNILLHPTPPLVAGGVVIDSSAFGALTARHISDGSLAWDSQVVPRPWNQESQLLPIPKVLGGVVYAAASPDSIAAWRIADGMLLWQSPPLTDPADPNYGSSFPQTQVPEPVVTANAVYFVTGRFVVAVSATDGNLLWSSAVLPKPVLPTNNFYTPPVLANGRLFVAATDGSLYALAADTGVLLWRATDPDMASMPAASPASPTDFAPPVVSDGIVYYVPLDGLRALAAGTGHLLWRLPTGAAWRAVPAVGGAIVYVATPNASGSIALLALDARTGAVRWKVAVQPDTAGVTVFVNGDVVFTTGPGLVAAWSASTGASLWQRTIQSPPSGFQQVVFDGGGVYVSMDGKGNGTSACHGITSQDLPTIAALRVSNGALLWRTTVQPA